METYRAKAIHEWHTKRGYPAFKTGECDYVVIEDGRYSDAVALLEYKDGRVFTVHWAGIF